jgi:hypothetical protein
VLPLDLDICEAPDAFCVPHQVSFHRIRYSDRGPTSDIRCYISSWIGNSSQ